VSIAAIELNSSDDQECRILRIPDTRQTFALLCTLRSLWPLGLTYRQLPLSDATYFRFHSRQWGTLSSIFDESFYHPLIPRPKFTGVRNPVVLVLLEFNSFGGNHASRRCSKMTWNFIGAPELERTFD